MLRIHDRGVVRREAEEAGVEDLDVVEHAPRAARSADSPSSAAGTPAARSSRVAEATRIDSTPSRTFRQNSSTSRGAGEAARHADDGDVGGREGCRAFAAGHQVIRLLHHRPVACGAAAPRVAPRPAWHRPAAVPRRRRPRQECREGGNGREAEQVGERERALRQHSRSRRCTCTASSEWPPRSKKLSSRPTCGSCSSSRQMPAIVSSMSLAGRRRSDGVAAAMTDGSGSACRSTLPLGVSGSARAPRRATAP